MTAPSNLQKTSAGHAYRVGKRWFVDTARLHVIASRSLVEPMRGGYQILAPGGLIRCTPVAETPLPDQRGDLYQCVETGGGADLGMQLQRLARIEAPALEWESWPTGPGGNTDKGGCGCHECTTGAACPCTRPVRPETP